MSKIKDVGFGDGPDVSLRPKRAVLCGLSVLCCTQGTGTRAEQQHVEIC